MVKDSCVGPGNEYNSAVMLTRNTVYRFAIASVGVLLLLAACEEAPVPDHKHALRPDIVVRDIKFQSSELSLSEGSYVASRTVEGMTAEWFEHGEVSAYVDLFGGEEFSGTWMPAPVVWTTFGPTGEAVSMIVSVFLGSIGDTYGIGVTVTLTTGSARPDPLPQTFQAGYIKVRVVYDPGRAATN